MEEVAAGIRGIVVIKQVVQWVAERGMEVNIEPHYKDFGQGTGWSVTADDTRRYASVMTYIDLEIINNRTDRLARILEIWGEWRTKTLLLRHKNLKKIAIEHPATGLYEKDKRIGEIVLEPQGTPYKITALVSGEIENIILPRKSELWIVLRMVGPIKRMERKMVTIDRKWKPPALQ